jgi:hypothetical protein
MSRNSTDLSARAVKVGSGDCLAMAGQSPERRAIEAFNDNGGGFS